MKDSRMIGFVKWFKENKGYGYINGLDDEVYYFEILYCVHKEESFKEGDKVLFVPHFTDLEYATQVEKVNEMGELE